MITYVCPACGEKQDAMPSAEVWHRCRGKYRQFEEREKDG